MTAEGLVIATCRCSSPQWVVERRGSGLERPLLLWRTDLTSDKLPRG